MAVRPEEFENFACVFIRTPSLNLSLTLRSALLWGAKAPVVANIAYYAMSLLSKSESISVLSSFAIFSAYPLVLQGHLQCAEAQALCNRKKLYLYSFPVPLLPRKYALIVLI